MANLTQEEFEYLDELIARGEDARAESEKQGLLKRRNDLKTLLSTDFGKGVIWDIMSRCDIFGVSHTGNSQTYFKEGRRSIGLELLAEVIAADPKAWIEIQSDRIDEIHQNIKESER